MTFGDGTGALPEEPSGGAELFARLPQFPDCRNDAAHAIQLSPTNAQITVDCHDGQALLIGERQIHWQVQSDRRSETLASERSDVEVMLDHFCRRVVGGLIPVADLNDIHRSLCVLAAARKSLESGQSASVSADA